MQPRKVVCDKSVFHSLNLVSVLCEIANLFDLVDERRLTPHSVAIILNAKKKLQINFG